MMLEEKKSDSNLKEQNLLTSQQMKKEKENFEKWRLIMKNKCSAAGLMGDLVKYPVISEKTFVSLFKNKQYTFDVDLRLNKTQIKKLFEQLFQVNVIGINTQRPPRQKKRAGITEGYKSSYKRVIVTLKEGQSL